MRKKGYIYFLDDHNGHVKIGLTDNMERRMKQLQTGNAMELTLIHSIKVDSMQDAFQLESILHHALNNHKVMNEWYEKKAVMKFLAHNWIHVGKFRFRGLGYPVMKIVLFVIAVITATVILNYIKF